MRWLLPVAVMAGILVVTSLPAPPPMPHQSDKVVHFVAYATLGASVSWANGSASAMQAARILVLLSIAGALDEWHQQFIPNRRMDVRDWVADTAGAVAGFTLVAALLRRRESVA